jgi:hypothetical protein
MSKPLLSIVSPTREGFSEHWLEELLKVKGEVEFILVHPPGMAKHPQEDSRLRQISSAIRGEIFQRMSGLLNATGTYILTINCDEYLTPDIAEIVDRYYQRFPENWVLRLSKTSYEYGDRSSLVAPWSTPFDVRIMPTCGKSQGNGHLFKEGNHLYEIPIAPLENKFDFGCLIRGRKDHHGAHTENFDKKVWKTQMVQATLVDLAQQMNIIGAVKYIPFWCLDRLLGLSIQAKFFESGRIIGHILPTPAQIRVEDNPPEHSRKNRFYVFAEIFLLKKFPQYGYIWNLIIGQICDIPLNPIRAIGRRLALKKG